MAIAAEIVRLCDLGKGLDVLRRNRIEVAASVAFREVEGQFESEIRVRSKSGKTLASNPFAGEFLRS